MSNGLCDRLDGQMDIAPTNKSIIRHFLRVAKFLLNWDPQ